MPAQPLPVHHRKGVGRIPASLLVAALLSLGGCTSEPGGEASTAAPTSELPTMPASSLLPSPSPEVPPVSPQTATLSIDISIAGGKVSPSGRRFDVRQGTTVMVTVQSDIDDEIHAHTGEDGFELPVRAGRAATGSFVVTSVGSFEIESHGLDKIIAILNVR